MGLKAARGFVSVVLAGGVRATLPSEETTQPIPERSPARAWPSCQAAGPAPLSMGAGRVRACV